MTIKSLNDLFVEELKDLYSAEEQLTKALPKMAKAAQSDDLRGAFEAHLKETEEHVSRLEEIFGQLELSPRGTKSEAMEGLIEEGKKVLEKDVEDNVRDAALISAAQRVEHYEIAAYGCTGPLPNVSARMRRRSFCSKRSRKRPRANKKLTQIALGGVNEAAVAAIDCETSRRAIRSGQKIAGSERADIFGAGSLGARLGVGSAAALPSSLRS